MGAWSVLTATAPYSQPGDHILPAAALVSMPKQEKKQQVDARSSPLDAKPRHKQPHAAAAVAQPTASKQRSKQQPKHQVQPAQHTQRRTKQHTNEQQRLADSANGQPAAAGVQQAVRDPGDDEVRRLFRSWAWKREHR